MNMDLLNHLNNILPFRTHILLSVSGGLDSMVLLNILQYTNLYISVIHVNFQLRESESNEDEFFIQDFCKYKKIIFYKKKFKTKTYSKENKKSIQVTARSLRFGWFFKILKNINASYILLGHHLNDTIETFFINLFRSSSLKGLISISGSSKYFLRPLLPFNKTNILQYAKIYNIWWREDKSNKNYKYLRNSIRNDLITNFYDRTSKSLSFLKKDYLFIQESIYNIFKIITIIFIKKKFYWEINKKKIKKNITLNIFFNKLFSPFGFRCTFHLENNFHPSTGKYFFSKKYRLLYYNNKLIFNSQQNKNKIFTQNYFFEINDFINQNALISIDFNTISWPIYLKNSKNGDFFLNPKGKKRKISKLFKEYKLSFFEKKEIIILLNSENKILWIINFIINFLFKITLKTNIILNIF